MSEKVRVRFAPSPTGYLHIGGARTALFNYLFARHEKGVFVLRIEDTDRERSTNESTQAILDGMTWLGMEWDEGPGVGGDYGPYFQSERTDIYKNYADQMLAKGLAYRCYCTQEELEERRQAALKEKRAPKYDGRCRNLKPGEQPDKPFSIRFRSPETGTTVFKDLIRGEISFENRDLDDLIIVRSDGSPTYNFTVVVDDVHMKMSHIIRGDDHINNTPRQILMYQAMGLPVPSFAHLPMILGSDKSRLSKRHGATSVTAYRDMGYLPQALVNYLVRLGWSYGDQEVFSKAEMMEKFSFENVGNSAGVFNPDKLLWLNQHYLKNEDPASIGVMLAGFVSRLGVDPGSDNAKLEKIVAAQRERSRTLEEMAKSSLYFFPADIQYDPKASAKFLTSARLPLLKELVSLVSAQQDFGNKALEESIVALAARLGIKLGEVAQPLRVALTGGTVSPGIFEVMEIMGRELVLKRLEGAAALAEKGAPALG
jgi:glutamyl-tRNA synthetase